MNVHQATDLFRRVLENPRVSEQDDFFHLGGDSLLAVQLVGRLHERFGVQIPLRAIWDIRTVTEVALLVARALDDAEGRPAAAESVFAAAEPQPA